MSWKWLVFIASIVIVTIVPDTVIWIHYGASWPWIWRVPYGITTFLVITSVWVMQTWPFGHVNSVRMFFGTMLLLAVPKLLFAILDPLTGWKIALFVALLSIAAFAYGFIYGWKRLHVVETEFCSADLPEAFDGYRILHLSDFHLGSLFNHVAFLEKLVDCANAQKPDLIVFTGDLVNIHASEAEPFLTILHKLKAPDGVLSVLGNHDMVDKAGISRLVEIERAVGWEPLCNSHKMLHRGTAEIAVAGVDNKGAPPFLGSGDLSAALYGIPSSTFTILLSHDPTHWRLEVLDCGAVQLTLSGHTHGGQIRIGNFSVARLLYKEWGGTYHSGGSMLHVSQGISGSVPFRLGAWPEMSVITLRRGHS